MTTRFASLIWLLLLMKPAVAAPPYWTLVWSDEFNEPAGTAPDPNKWVFDLGAGGFGNQELETYTSGRENSYLDGAGNLVIVARESAPGQYTSARLKTLSKFAVKYGRIEARIKLPAGQGLWAAFWMMGVDAVTTGWPQCGEIDIMESLGHEPSTVHATIHGPGYSGADGVTRTYTLPDAQWLAADYHVFATEWSPNTIQFLIDGHVYHTVTPAELPKGAAWVFQHPFFLLLNLAVGGSLPGNPDATTVFPRQMLVDYVRVYQHRGRARMK